MISYMKNENYYFLSRDNKPLERRHLQHLIGVNEYYNLIDNFIIYCKRFNLLSDEDLYIVSKNEKTIQKTVDYINSVLVMKSMEEKSANL